jgi:hypothetical protein
LFVLVVLACASSERNPPAPTPAQPATAVGHTSEPPPAEPPLAEPPLAEPPPPSVPIDEVTLHCALGLTPASASDGRRSVRHGIELRHDFAMVKIEMSGPPHRAHLLAKSADELAHVRGLAAAVLGSPMPAASAPVPDGQICQLRIATGGVTKIDARVDPTPPSGPLADLVMELRKWMHASEPTWPDAKDPEVAQCMKAAKLEKTAKFHLREIVIESDGKRRYEFLDPTEMSTGNHFGCRFIDGKPHILPEG